MFEILSQSVWRDEAFSLLISKKTPYEIIFLSVGDTSPPLYYLILHYYLEFFGSDPFRARLLSLFFHLLSSLVSLLIARRIFFSKFWVLPSFLMVFFHPLLLHYAFEVRAYSLYVFLILFSLYLFIRGSPILFSFFLSLSVLTHNFSLFVFTSFFLSWFAMSRKFKGDFSKRVRSFAYHFLLPAVVQLIWMPGLLRQWSAVSKDFWIKDFVYPDFIRFLGFYPLGSDIAILIYGLLLLILVTSLLNRIYLSWRRMADEKFTFIFLTILPIAVTILVSLVRRPIFQDRYLIHLPPVVIIFFFWAVSYIIKSSPVLILAVLAYLVMFLGIDFKYLDSPQNPPLHQTVKEISRLARQGDIVIPESILNFLEIKFYLDYYGSPLRVFAYNREGSVAFYLGSVLYEKGDIISTLPPSSVWLVSRDGTFNRLTSDQASKILNSS